MSCRTRPCPHLVHLAFGRLGVELVVWMERWLRKRCSLKGGEGSLEGESKAWINFSIPLGGSGTPSRASAVGTDALTQRRARTR